MDGLVQDSSNSECISNGLNLHGYSQIYLPKSVRQWDTWNGSVDNQWHGTRLFVAVFMWFIQSNNFEQKMDF